MGPLAGIAAGLGLAALASHLGFGDELASMVMMGLLVFAVILAIGFVLRKRAGAQTPIGAAPNGMQYARIDPHTEERTAPAYKVAMPNTGDGAVVSPTGGQQTRERFVPADFDAPGFERHVVSVRFTGVIRYQGETADEPFDEIWHLTKPRQGSGGWVVSGIQQTA